MVNFGKVNAALIFDAPKKIEVERNGEKKEIVLQKYINDKTLEKLEKSRKPLVSFRFPFEIDSVTNRHLIRVGMKASGEKLLSVNDKKIVYYDEFKSEVEKNKGKKIKFRTMRDDQMIEYQMTVPNNGTIGFFTKQPDDFLKFERINYSLLGSIPAGIRVTFEKLTGYVKSLSLLFDSEAQAYKSIGGFGSMASATPKEFSMEGFLVFTAVISIILAFMNFLPIPMLDGGYVVFILYEMITRRQPSEKFMEITNYFGMIFLFGLMIFANGNDIYKAIFGRW